MNAKRFTGGIAVIVVGAFLLAGCDCECDDGDADETEADPSEGASDAEVPADAGVSADAEVDTDASVGDEPITLAAAERCLTDEDCGGNYCCPLFHYCVERCEELGEPCSNPIHVCKQGFAEPLCNYNGPDLEKEYALGGGGTPCMLDEDCLPGFFCAPTLRFCVERCDEEGETCTATGHTCTAPSAYDVFALPMLACVYQEGDGTGAGDDGAEIPEVEPASQQQRENACDCMFASGVYPDPSLLDACVDRVSDKCVNCLEDVIDDTSACDQDDEEAVLSCTDPCARTLPPPETEQECKEFVDTVESPLPTSQTDCFCENCTYWYGLCLVDPDCYEHLACTIETGCEGFDCSLTDCADITDRLLSNNPDSINISREVAVCMTDADCG